MRRLGLFLVVCAAIASGRAASAQEDRTEILRRIDSLSAQLELAIDSSVFAAAAYYSTEIALAYYHSSRPEEACEFAARALEYSPYMSNYPELIPDSTARYIYGINHLISVSCSIKLQRCEEARRHALAAVKLDPCEATEWLRLYAINCDDLDFLPDWIEKGLANCANPSRRIHLLFDLLELSYREGDFEQCARWVEDIARESDPWPLDLDTLSQVVVYEARAIQQCCRGHADYERWYSLALNMARESGLDFVISTLFSRSALLHMYFGRTGKAIEQFDSAIVRATSPSSQVSSVTVAEGISGASTTILHWMFSAMVQGVRAPTDQERIIRLFDLSERCSAWSFRQALSRARLSEVSTAAHGQSGRSSDADPLQPRHLAEIRRDCLRQGQILIRYFTTPGTGLAIAVDRDSIWTYKVPTSMTTRMHVKALCGAHRHGQSHQDMSLFIERSSQLYELLLGPIEPYIDNKELLIIPDGELCYLPFGILVSQAESDGEGELRETKARYLARSNPITYAPSASVLCRLMEGKPHDAQGGLCVFGKSSFEGAELPDRQLLGDVLAELPDLPFVSQEIRRLGEVYANTPEGTSRSGLATFADSSATEEALKKVDLSQAKYLHIATHALINDSRPEYSAFLLDEVTGGQTRQDGVVYAHEVASLGLNTDLVTLSACNTGLGDLLQGEGIVGFSRAFIAAGARSMCLSMWPVRDESTATFMEAFYRRLLNGMPKSKALQGAKVYMMDSTQYNSPYCWGPFVLYGSPN